MGFDPTTFLFELVNFGLLLWILQRVLYRPLREGIERRRAEIASQHERAAAEQSEARGMRLDAEARLAEVEKVRETIVADAREQAAKEEARILEQARQDAASERERVQRMHEREREEALAWVREATVDNATEIAGRLLKDLLPAVADGALTRALLESLAQNRETLRTEVPALAHADGRLNAELRVPHPLADELLDALRQALADTYPALAVDLVVREDESLLAGPVLRIGDHLLDASVAGHLSVLRDRARELVERTLDSD